MVGLVVWMVLVLRGRTLRAVREFIDSFSFFLASGVVVIWTLELVV